LQSPPVDERGTRRLPAKGLGANTFEISVLEL